MVGGFCIQNSSSLFDPIFITSISSTNKLFVGALNLSCTLPLSSVMSFGIWDALLFWELSVFKRLNLVVSALPLGKRVDPCLVAACFSEVASPLLSSFSHLAAASGLAEFHFCSSLMKTSFSWCLMAPLLTWRTLSFTHLSRLEGLLWIDPSSGMSNSSCLSDSSIYNKIY